MNKTIALTLCSLLILSLFGCRGADESRINANTNEPDIAAAQGADGFVVDASGTKLQIPDSNDITIASVYAVAVPFIVALELTDNVVAVNYKSIFWAENSEGLAKADSVGRGIVDMEALAALSPDILIHRTNDPRTLSAVEELGIPVMSIKAENVDDIMSTLDLMGRYFHADERAAEVKQWMIDKFDKIASIAEGIPEEERFTAVMMGGELGVVAGGDMLQSWMIEHTGARSMASEIEGGNIDGYVASAWANIGMERLFTLNPDVIFCTSSTVLDYSVEEILSDTTLSGLEAVKSGRVFQMPAKWDSWDLPGVSCVIGTMWMLHSMYPWLISIEEMQAEIDEYYTFMFGRTFDSEYLGYDLDSDVRNYPGSVEEPELSGDAEIPGFTINVQGVEITGEDLSELPVYSVETTSTNRYGTTATRVYVGFKLSDVLEAAGITESFTTLAAIANDGYTVSVSKETAMEPTTLVAFSEDGKLLRSGPWFAPCSSNITPDYLIELTTLKLEN